MFLAFATINIYLRYECKRNTYTLLTKEIHFFHTVNLWDENIRNKWNSAVIKKSSFHPPVSFSKLNLSHNNFLLLENSKKYIKLGLLSRKSGKGKVRRSWFNFRYWDLIKLFSSVWVFLAFAHSQMLFAIDFDYL